MLLASHSYYSLRYGVLSPRQLVKVAANARHPVITLTDINNVTGVFEFVKACNEYRIHPVVGIEFRVGSRYLYSGIARDTEGLARLNEFLSYHTLNGIPLPVRAPSLERCFWIYPWNNFPPDTSDVEYLGVTLADRGRLLTASRKQLSKMVIRQPLTFTTELGYRFHQHLRAIDQNMLLSKLDLGLAASPDDCLHTPTALKEAFETWPQLYANTQRLLLQCDFRFDFDTPKNKQTYTGSRSDDHILLRKLAYEGFALRYGNGTPFAKERLEQELQTICNLGFAAYFLITRDIVNYSLSHGIYHVGRGSGANSLVAYCLRITDVDPIELNLYFERFINPNRSSPPDFDIDYSWRDRDRVLDYIFKRFGSRHTALLATISTFQTNSAIRELSKVYGIPKEEIDRLICDLHNNKPKNQLETRILSLARYMVDFPNLRSIHAGGVLISEHPIFYYTALDLPPKGFPTTQWDMYAAESIGFEKIDILSQRGIGHLGECIQIIKRSRNTQIDIHQVETFKNDEKTLRLLRSGETIGCFYIESPAMRGLLKKLRCDDYKTLVATSSIIRPGVAQSGMMAEYIRRYHNPKSFHYLHPIIEEQLSETFGIMVYQEDVLKVCHHFAGLDLADADVLRRIMSGKHRKKGDLERIANRYFDNCRQRNYPPEVVNELWRQISSFAGYSFSKAHSASYASESFQSLYLKAHYPLEFITAVINNFGGFYKTWVYVHEARRLGANVELPCVNQSNYESLVSGTTIYLGFNLVELLEINTVKKILEERRRNGSFKNLYDFVRRVDIGIAQLRLLIRLGAFRFAEKNKALLLWKAHWYHNQRDNNKDLPQLFQTPQPKVKLHLPQNSDLEDAYDEIELLGFPVSLSYFQMLEAFPDNGVTANDLVNYAGKRIQITALLVDIKYVWTKHKQIMHFANFIDREGNFFDTVHFPQSLRKSPFTGGGMYHIGGKVVVEFGHPSVEVEYMERLSLKPDPRAEHQPQVYHE